MIVLILGLALWVLTHFLQRISPAGRAALDEKFGPKGGRGVVAGLILLSVILMIFGYRWAEDFPVYQPMAGIGHLTVLLMFFALMLMGMGGSKGRMKTWFRHPMLMGIIVWSVAHLLVNGDQPSIVLWGGMIAWAIAEIIIINRAVGPLKKPEPGPAKGDIKLLVITAVLFLIFTALHTVFGYNPFLGTYG